MRRSGYAIRFHPLVSERLDVGSEGDELAMFLDIAEGVQREDVERLLVSAHHRSVLTKE